MKPKHKTNMEKTQVNGQILNIQQWGGRTIKKTKINPKSLITESCTRFLNAKLNPCTPKISEVTLQTVWCTTFMMLIVQRI